MVSFETSGSVLKLLVFLLISGILPLSHRLQTVLCQIQIDFGEIDCLYMQYLEEQSVMIQVWAVLWHSLLQVLSQCWRENGGAGDRHYYSCPGKKLTEAFLLEGFCRIFKKEG